MIRENISKYRARKQIIKHVKFEKEESKSNLVNSKVKKLYEYYVCDYCKSEIRLDLKKSERSGGLVVIPRNITRSVDIKLALCNKCLRKVLNEFQ